MTPFEAQRLSTLARKLSGSCFLSSVDVAEYESLMSLRIEETRIAIIKGKGWTMVPYKHERPVRYIDPDSILPITVAAGPDLRRRRLTVG